MRTFCARSIKHTSDLKKACCGCKVLKARTFIGEQRGRHGKHVHSDTIAFATTESYSVKNEPFEGQIRSPRPEDLQIWFGSSRSPRI